jgi:hypothetical protein
VQQGEYYEDPNPRAQPVPAAPSGTAADYPYDPRLRVELLTGLDKLRAVRDRETAQLLYELYFVAERNQRDPRFWKERERLENKQRAEEEQARRVLASRALDGKLGQEARDLAIGILVDTGGKVRTDMVAIDLFNREWRKLRGY